MSSSLETIDPSRHPRRLALGRFEQHLYEAIRRQPLRRRGVLAIGISRSDRIRALIGLPAAMQVQNELLDALESGLRADDRYAIATPEEIWVWLAEAKNESICRLAAHGLRERLNGTYECLLDGTSTDRVHVETAVGGTFDLHVGNQLGDLGLGIARMLAEARAAEGQIAIVASSSFQGTRLNSDLEPLLRRALEANELEVHYQPIINLADMRCSGLEALVRWPQPPGRAPVSAPTVVSVCENAGMIGELTRFVLNTGVRHLSEWQLVGPPPDLSINLSTLSLSDESFPMLIEQICDIWAIPPTRLCFELTEGSIARNNRTSVEFMQQIRGRGCRLSIDDFGTGYSSFSYLRQFPVDELKIDKSFVRDITGDSPDTRIVKMLVEIAHAFDLTAVAEGVENATALANLIGIGCDSVQGWHFSKALRPEDVAAWINGFQSHQSTEPQKLRSA
jgi:EAL domain-containing protein (putative c-di-GMP-specific phosphodiesterase class I)